MTVTAAHRTPRGPGSRSSWTAKADRPAVPRRPATARGRSGAARDSVRAPVCPSWSCGAELRRTGQREAEIQQFVQLRLDDLTGVRLRGIRAAAEPTPHEGKAGVGQDQALVDIGDELGDGGAGTGHGDLLLSAVGGAERRNATDPPASRKPTVPSRGRRPAQASGGT